MERPHRRHRCLIQGQRQAGAFGAFDKELHASVLGQQVGDRTFVSDRRGRDAQPLKRVGKLVLQGQAMAGCHQQPQAGRRGQ